MRRARGAPLHLRARSFCRGEEDPTPRRRLGSRCHCDNRDLEEAFEGRRANFPEPLGGPRVNWSEADGAYSTTGKVSTRRQEASYQGGDDPGDHEESRGGGEDDRGAAGQRPKLRAARLGGRRQRLRAARARQSRDRRARPAGPGAESQALWFCKPWGPSRFDRRRLPPTTCDIRSLSRLEGPTNLAKPADVWSATASSAYYTLRNIERPHFAEAPKKAYCTGLPEHWGCTQHRCSPW